MYKVVPSAKLQTSVSFIKRSKSFMKMLNKIGPNIDLEGHVEQLLAIRSCKNLFLPAVFFLTNNFKSILDYPHLVRMLLI